MNELVSEWIRKADEDYYCAKREAEIKDNPAYDVVCFHAQQAIEKYLKARLQAADIEFPKVHDLRTLLDLSLPVEPNWEGMRDDLEWLDSFAVEVRYPGTFALAEDAFKSIRILRRLRPLMRKALGLSENDTP